MTTGLLERFLRYVRLDTQSDPDSGEVPSTAGQLLMLNMLADELNQMGATEVKVYPDGYLTATIPATVPEAGTEWAGKDECAGKLPVIGFIAHVDTSPDLSGCNVSPQLTGNEDGEIIITGDGTTLLGADDKAGVAEIMTAAGYLLAHPEIPHGKIRIAFTTDEEIGRGADRFDVASFGADYAYTVDGGGEGAIEFETFNAAEAVITINGFNTHPGYAEGVMINSQLIAFELAALLPQGQRPENTSGREGFFHLTSIKGSVERTLMQLIIRDHDRAEFEKKKDILWEAVDAINARYGGKTPNVERPDNSCAEGASEVILETTAEAVSEVVSEAASKVASEVVSVKIRDQYYNMREVIEKHPQLIEYAFEAMEMAGIEPLAEPVRGGTDGCRLSFMGLPCPNLFCGAENIHSRNEFVSLNVMGRAVEVIVNICKLFYSKTLGI